MKNHKNYLSIIIVNYNSYAFTTSCIKSISKSNIKHDWNVIVVDNSREVSLKNFLQNNYKKFPRVTYIPLKSNVGYSKANNIGIRKSKSKYIMILNPDTRVNPNSINKLIAFMDKNLSFGAVAPTLINKDGESYMQIGVKMLNPLNSIFILSFFSKVFPNNYFMKQYWNRNRKTEKIDIVELIPGSAMLLRRSAMSEVGNFDENFFLYFEEADLSKRLSEKGWRLAILRNATVFHEWGGSTIKSKKTTAIFKESRFYFFRKHYGLVPAIFLEFFLNINKKNTTLLIIMILVICKFLLF